MTKTTKAANATTTRESSITPTENPAPTISEFIAALAEYEAVLDKSILLDNIFLGDDPKSVYLATPYASEDEAVTLYRLYYTRVLTAFLSIKQAPVYAPILQGHSLVERFPGVDNLIAWAKLEAELISKFDLVAMLLLPGWRNSKGLFREARTARRNSVPIVGVSVMTCQRAERELMKFGKEGGYNWL